ncbi:MAG: Asp23/Gls24 family envelope stress response protein [Coriobacteriales bacterium]|nr:Asp23/Gls24 family envelope stress response protein [Coriobacteriales bacterium]
MSQDIQFNGLVVAADVVETIVRLSAEKVDGVACVGSSTDLPTVFSMFGSKKVSSVPAVGVKVEDDAMRIAVHVSVFFGFPFKSLQKRSGARYLPVWNLR